MFHYDRYRFLGTIVHIYYYVHQKTKIWKIISSSSFSKVSKVCNTYYSGKIFISRCQLNIYKLGVSIYTNRCNALTY